MSERIRLGVSACLLGELVRYDGGHKHNTYITQTLGAYFDFVPLCPEVAIGMGVPRAPIRLVREAGEVRARGVENLSLDVTDKLTTYAKHVVPMLKDVGGYILKRASPSCGIARVKIFGARSTPRPNGIGIYARTLLRQLPELPFEEESGLLDPDRRDNFLERVFVYHRWQRLLRGSLSMASLADFHERHAFLVMAHHETIYRAMGQRLASARRGDLPMHAERYGRLLMRALRIPVTRGRHTKQLRRLLGILGNHLNAEERRELQNEIHRYRAGSVALEVPRRLFRHYLDRIPEPRLTNQHYLYPHPDELALRNGR